MASLVLKMSVSLDGYVAPTDGSTDWVAAGRSDDGASWTVETLSNAGAHLMGANTYAGWATYWPGASGPFAKPMNEIPKVVFSDSLASADSIAAGLTKITREPRPQNGPPLAPGSRYFSMPSIWRRRAARASRPPYSRSAARCCLVRRFSRHRASVSVHFPCSRTAPPHQGCQELRRL